jgi:SAM-dependent methyltransferase
LIVSTFRRRFPAAQSFLEIGCGSGVVLAALHDAFRAAPHGQRALRGGSRHRETPLADADLVILDARELSYVDAFDVVGAFDVLEHIDEDELVLGQMVRAARPGGGLLILVPSILALDAEHDEIVEPPSALHPQGARDEGGARGDRGSSR